MRRGGEGKTGIRFPGIPRTPGEKKGRADGKTGRKTKKEARRGRKDDGPTDEEILACAMIETEEEFAELFGE